MSWYERRINPVTRRRLRRFREMKRGWWSLWILVFAYCISLGSELLSNDKPYFVRYEGKTYFPMFKYYPDDVFTGSGHQTRPDYKRIRNSEPFRANAKNTMVFPPHPYGPYEILDPASIAVKPEVRIEFQPMPRVASISLNGALTIERADGAGPFFGLETGEAEGKDLSAYFSIPNTLRDEVLKRLENRAAERFEAELRALRGQDTVAKKVIISLSSYSPRRTAPPSVRATLRDPPETAAAAAQSLLVGPDGEILGKPSPAFSSLSEDERKNLIAIAVARFDSPVQSRTMTLANESWHVNFHKTDVRWPFPPTKRHPLGVDEAGRDVLARILYGLRISMTFGLVLVLCTMFIGIIIGAVQGYFGGLLDISAQRMIEIWSALPFLYIMILFGSIFGRGFMLLLLVYGIFNWIGISYYMRAEFLRLRHQQFVEAARCLGVPTWKILFKHIFPNALVPIITFFPFSLVGAIGSLAALDYLGFGMPPPTASWGELLNQAQTIRWAWWLILYPSVSLFVVMLLGVFVGESVRNAWDPRDYTGVQ